MKTIFFNTFFVLIIISFDAHAWMSFDLDDMQWSNRSGSIYGAQSQQLRIIKGQDFSNYYLYIELSGIKPDEVNIQRQGLNIIIEQQRGRMEKNQTENYYSSYKTYSSFTRRLTLPPDAEIDPLKMKQENKDNVIRLTIPKHKFQHQGLTR